MIAAAGEGGAGGGPSDAVTDTERRIDEAFAAEHGNTAADASREDEEHPEIQPTGPKERVEKAKAEVSEKPGVAGKVKAALEEVDREIAGEYERREDPAGPEQPGG